ncbi:hypothetical protein [uncultured Clostridium sp.]|uniref:hypothetical protein n=1 Tax=uncultured Clostridium sp. TaxID=59620 RepID=UPI0026F3F5A4|nr:hypothetical protein [uncultured Clostridium sp.]
MRYISLREVRKRVDNLDEETKVKYVQTIAVGLTVRYGIYGRYAEEILGMKLEHINKEKKTIDLYDSQDNYIRTMQVDDYLINWLELASNTQMHNNMKLKSTDYIFKSSTRRTKIDITEKALVGTINGRVIKFLKLIDFKYTRILDWFMLREIDYAENFRKKNGICTSLDYIKIVYTLRGKINKEESLDLKTAHLNLMNGKEFFYNIKGARKPIKITNTYINEIISALDSLYITG